MSQVRYGAESGVHAAANHLLHTYVAPGSSSPIRWHYDMTGVAGDVQRHPVVLSSDPAVPSNYPVQAWSMRLLVGVDRHAERRTTQSVVYTARATLLSMRQLTDDFTGLPVTLQTWEIVGHRPHDRIRAPSLVEVSAIIERQPVPVFSYAAFATFHRLQRPVVCRWRDDPELRLGCPLVGRSTRWRRLSAATWAPTATLTATAIRPRINGTLSTPRAGVGNCTTNNVTAATISGWATVEEGLVTLPQPSTFPTPPATRTRSRRRSPISSITGADCTPAPFLRAQRWRIHNYTPTASTVVTLGNVSLNGNTVLHLNAGIYGINSLKLNGNAKISWTPDR